MGYRGDPEKLITTTHAARYWGCDTETVRKGIHAGLIKAVQAPDGFWWVRQGELYRLKVLRPGTPHRIRVRPDWDRERREEQSAEGGHAALDAELRQKVEAG